MTTADIINTWFRERIANGAVARDTEAYNQIHAALADLVDRIDRASAGLPVAAADAPAAPAAKASK